MKAAYITKTGPPEEIIYGDLPDPKPSRKQCLIKVAAVDMNPIDTYVRSGTISPPPTFPWIPGRDLAGTVIEAGPGVKGVKVGDRVWASNQGIGGRSGSFDELVVVVEEWLSRSDGQVCEV